MSDGLEVKIDANIESPIEDIIGGNENNTPTIDTPTIDTETNNNTDNNLNQELIFPNFFMKKTHCL